MLDIALREPPHSIELEQSIIGAILVDNAALDKLGNLAPDDFYEPVHQQLFAAAREQWQTSKAVNLATLRGIIHEARPITETLTLAGYIKRLVSIGDSRNIAALAETQRDYATRRKLCETATYLDAAARNPTLPAGEAINLTVSTLDTVLSHGRTKGPTRRTAGDAFREAMDAMVSDDRSEIITSGLRSLDAVTGGWRRKEFAILAGRPSMGKSTVALSSAVASAQAGVGVMLFSLEMPMKPYATRMMCDLAWTPDNRVSYADALAKALNDRELGQLGRAAAHYEQLPITIDDQRGLTMAEIAARARAEAQRMERAGHRLGLVVVDHLGLIKPSGRYAGNKVQEVGEISDALATLAKDLDVAVLALQQLNRGTESRENKRPTLADLRNSGDLEQDADIVCFAYRQSYYLERTKFDPGSQQEYQRLTDLEACRNTLDVMVAKNRNGRTETVTLFCDMGANVVRDGA